MSEQPSHVLNVDEDDKKEGSEGRLWLWALVSPVICIAISLVVAMSKPVPQSDWLGMTVIATILIGSIVGAFICTGITIASFVRGERHSWRSLFLGLPSAIIVIKVLITFVEVFAKRA